MTETELLTIREVADILKCDVSTLSRLVKKGLFPGARKFNPTGVTSPIRIPRASVEAYIQSQIITPEKE